MKSDSFVWDNWLQIIDYDIYGVACVLRNNKHAFYVIDHRFLINNEDIEIIFNQNDDINNNKDTDDNIDDINSII